MTMKKVLNLIAAAGIALLGSYGLADASGSMNETKIKVQLWDKGAAAEIKTDMGVGMAGDHTKSNMGLKLSQKQANAGKVTFEVVNTSKETIHEMIVIPYPADGKVPYSDKDARFDEELAGHLGEVSELDPGKTGSLTLELKPGKYIVACNIATHYANGMWAVITVK